MSTQFPEGASPEELRQGLVDAMLRLDRVAYDDRHGIQQLVRGQRPSQVDCSAAIEWVCREVFYCADWLCHDRNPYWVPKAKEFWKLTGWRTSTPLPGDLVIYSRNDGAEHHVMMLMNRPGCLVMGSCAGPDEFTVCPKPNPIPGRVEGHPIIDYSAEWDMVELRWQFLGYVEMPVVRNWREIKDPGFCDDI